MDRIFTISIIIAYIFFTSCEKRSEAVEGMGVPLVIEDISLSTKAIVNENLPPASTIGVQVMNAGGTALYSDDSNNLKYTLAGTWDTHSPFTLAVDVGIVYAYHPYTDELTGTVTDFTKATIPVVLHDVLPGADNDYMYYHVSDESLTSRKVNGNTGDGNVIDLILNHALSKVTFNFYLENYYGGTAILNEFTVGNRNDQVVQYIQTTSSEESMSMDIKTGDITGGVAGSIKRIFGEGHEITATKVNKQNNTDAFSFLVCPFGAASTSTGAEGDDIQVDFKIDGLSYTVNIPVLAATSKVAWERGNNNFYDIKISSKEVGINLMGIVGWNEEEEIIDADIIDPNAGEVP